MSKELSVRVTRNADIIVGRCDRHYELSDYEDKTPRVVVEFMADCRGDSCTLCFECLREAFALYAEKAGTPPA